MNYLDLYKNELVEIFYDDDFDTLDAGYIIGEDNEYLLLHFINTRGLLDGYNLIYKAHINCIKKRTQYLKELAILEKEMRKNEMKSALYQAMKFEIPSDNLLINLLNIIYKNKSICKVILFGQNDAFFGFIKAIYEKQIVMSYFDKEKMIEIKQIKYLYFDSSGQKADFLVANQKRKKQ